MPRMARHPRRLLRCVRFLVASVAILSLVLCLATAALWFDSYLHGRRFWWRAGAWEAGHYHSQIYQMRYTRGRLLIMHLEQWVAVPPKQVAGYEQTWWAGMAPSGWQYDSTPLARFVGPDDAAAFGLAYGRHQNMSGAVTRVLAVPLWLPMLLLAALPAGLWW